MQKPRFCATIRARPVKFHIHAFKLTDTTEQQTKSNSIATTDDNFCNEININAGKSWKIYSLSQAAD